MIEKLEKFLEWGGIKREIILLIISAIALLLSIFDINIQYIDMAWIAIVLCGIPIILEAVIGLITAFDIKADVLVSLALLASIFIGEYFAAGEVAFIMQLGALLEDLTVAKANAGIEKLVRLTPQVARLLKNNQEEMISAKDVQIDDVIRVLPGEMIPVDGVIISGETSINQAVMTGESLPVDKKTGDEVSSGTVNQFGTFDMRAVKVGEDSSIQRMIRLVQSANANKAKIVNIADRWATWVVIIALTAAILTWFVTGEILRSVTILVVFCPCSLVLATPTAIMAASGNATEHGFLIREGDALERLSSVSKITFDKTGTLTYGKPQVTLIKNLSDNYEDKELFKIAAAIESYSQHPLGKAIVSDYKKAYGEFQVSVENFQMSVGLGIKATVNNQTVLAGNKDMLYKENISLSKTVENDTQQYIQQGSTVIYIVINQGVSGYLVLTDTVRKESLSMIEKLHQLKVDAVLLTGDHQNAAKTIAKQLNIQELYAKCLPEDKLKIIDTYQKQKQEICMIGDGINDAPALKKANVGIAMGGIGSDIAVDAADIVLVHDEIQELPHLIALSKKMIRTIRFNLSFSMGLNFLAIILAMTGILNPVIGALVHNAGSVFVIINSALLLKWRGKEC